MQNEERRKRELKKQQQYNSDVFANKETEPIQKSELETGPEVQQQSIHPVPYKESIFKKLLNRIRGFFKK